MSSAKTKRIYRIQYYNQQDIYELYARKISQDFLYAFLEVEDIIFGERSSVLVDPSEEKLKSEFAGVKRTYIPLQFIIRIDEVEKEGANKIISGNGKPGAVAHFPSPSIPTPAPRKD
jgi:hypothetical protein